MIPTVEQLAELAQETEITDPIDWGQLQITKQQAYLMMAANVLEQFLSIPESQRPIVAMATVTKLLVENFVLNVKLESKT
jgi:hypothetical protein